MYASTVESIKRCGGNGGPAAGNVGMIHSDSQQIRHVLTGPVIFSWTSAVRFKFVPVGPEKCWFDFLKNATDSSERRRVRRGQRDDSMHVVPVHTHTHAHVFVPVVHIPQFRTEEYTTPSYTAAPEAIRHAADSERSLLCESYARLCTDDAHDIPIR